MSERIQRRTARGTGTSRQTDEAHVEQHASVPAGQTVDYDALLAEIDGVLEADAEEYVRSFVQKGGQ